MEFNFLEDHEFTSKELRQFHHLCRIRNLDMTPSNHNIWQSNIFLFHYLGKVSECNPNLAIQIQALDLNDVQGALKLISNYYHEWQEPEIYAKALENKTIQIHPGWTNRSNSVSEEGGQSGWQTYRNATVKIFISTRCLCNSRQILGGF
jgi:hypothetical protein